MPSATTIRDITPADARRMLEKNTNNRPLRDSWVEQLVGLIRDGKWAVTHQGIGISETGRVLDGQHRLHAILRSGRTVQVMVTTGMDEDMYRWIDGGKSRTVADRIHLVDDPGMNKTACGLISAYLTIAEGVDCSQRFSVDEVENCFLDMTDAWIFASGAFSVKVRGISIGPVGAALAVYHNKTETKAREFMEMILRGEHLTHSHPAYVLREALLAKRLHGVHEIYWKTMGACMAHIEGRSIERLLAAVEDFKGNKYMTLVWARQRKNEKIGETVTKLKATPRRE
jgi:hypothetical protein